MLQRHDLLRILAAALLWLELPALQAATLPSTGLMGVVKSSEGKPMEGVAVSARASDKRFTTSVYTDQAGQYFFPPLADGRYRMWAQAVGFDTARAELTIAPGKKIQQNFTLKPLRDFSQQLSGTEWTDSLPADTPADRRVRRGFYFKFNNCPFHGIVLS